ncbi:MAG: DUF4180 domain-containing protein [Clostridiales bacterium]|jgi:hypothetical protein|nr:DUF4180 domain-containing protein [Clostridiales bacterium]
MDKRIIERNGVKIAAVGQTRRIADARDALDLIADVGWHDECDRLIVPKDAFCEGFFDLKTGIAGEVLQKFVNYSKKLAVVGDFSGCASTALRDFIVECNRGAHVFFAATEEEAVEKLSK